MDTAAEKEPVFGMDEGERLNVGRKNNFLKGKWGKRRETLAARRVRVLRVKGIGCERWRWLDSWNAERNAEKRQRLKRGLEKSV